MVNVLIEATMYIALGFFTAGLLAMALFAAIWRRAVRLTRKAMEASTPLTLHDVQTNIDSKRAGYALENRRLEIICERRLQEVTASRLAEAKAQANETNLRLERDALEVALAEAISREGGLRKERTSLEEDLARANARIRQLDRDLERHGKLYNELVLRHERAADDLDPAPAQDAPSPQVEATSTPMTTESALSFNMQDIPPKERHDHDSRPDAGYADLEARYVAALADVTRLSLQLEQLETSARATPETLDEMQGHNSRMRELVAENQRLQAERMTDQDFKVLRNQLMDIAAHLTIEAASEEDLAPLNEPEAEAAAASKPKTGRDMSARIRALRRQMKKPTEES